MPKKIYCPRCQQELAEINFFTAKDKTKFEMCKACTCAHVDNFDPETFTWILQKADVPYIESKWAKIRDKVIKEKGYEGLLSTSVVGKYLSLMKMKQNSSYTWADTEELNAKDREKEAAAEQKVKESAEKLKKDLDEGKISQQEYDTLASAPPPLKEEHMPPPTPEILAEIEQKKGGGGAGPVTSLNLFDEDKFMAEDELPDPAADMTQDEKLELVLKWGRLYTPQELLSLEKYYREMMSSFDIHDADTINTLRLLSKTVLKMDEALDRGDTDTYLKLSKVADMQRKSAKFTAAQNKADNINTFDSVGAVVALCEKEGGFIPQYAPEYPQDKIDITLKDTQQYLYNLVTEDLGFAQQLENAIKTLQSRKEAEELAEKETELDSYYSADRHILKDESFEDFYESIEEQRAHDAGAIGLIDLSNTEV